MATNNNNTRVQIPSKFSLLGNDGLVSQPWAYYLNSVTANLPPIGAGYVIDGSTSTTGATTLYQGPDSEKSGVPHSNDVYIANDTGAIYTVQGGQWQKQIPAFTGDVLKNAFSTVTTLATVNSTTGTFGSASTVPIITVNEKGLVTNVELVTINANVELPGKIGDFTYVAAAGQPAANNLFNIGTFTVTYKQTFHQADATPKFICTVPSNTVISNVELKILTAFNGTNPTVGIGQGSTYNDLMATTDNNPQVLGNWAVEPSLLYTSGGDIYVAISAGGGTTGYALVVISTVQT